ncbi:MAG: FAD-dependent oxidoreductase, partial [Nitrospiraceae bacterium]
MSAVILGGGPAGAAAALTLLDAQIPVTIVEREPFPRYRPGETLHPGV